MTYYVKDMKTLEVREYNTFDDAMKGAETVWNSTGNTIRVFTNKLSSGMLVGEAYHIVGKNNTVIEFKKEKV
jgi:hypothetical protein